MPQFDPSTFASQIFWLVVCFVALYVLVSRFAIPRISEVLEQRARMIEDDLDRAQTLKTEMEEAHAAYEKALADARAEARTVLHHAQEVLSREAEARNAEVAARLATQIKEGEARIGKAREEALSSVRVIAAEAAAAAAERLTGVSVDQGTVEAAVASALMRGAGKDIH